MLQLLRRSRDSHRLTTASWGYYLTFLLHLQVKKIDAWIIRSYIYIYNLLLLILFWKIKIKRDEIQRIKSANPEIPHREAFSAAAKNVRQQSLLFTTRSNYIFTKFICITEICDKQWAKYIPNSPTSIASGASNIHVSYTNELSLRTDI